MGCGAVWDAQGHGSLASLLQHLCGVPQNPNPSPCPLLFEGRKVAFRTQWDGWREPQRFTDYSLVYLGQRDDEELGSPALGMVAQSWHHPNIPEPPLISSAGLSDALCRIQPSRDSQGPGTGLWLGGRRPQSSLSWGLPARSGLVLQEPFPPIFLVSWCLQRWGKHPGSVCGSEELRYLGASGLGKIP